MKSVELTNLTDDQKEIILKLGMLKIIEIIFEGMPPVDRLRKNITYITEKTGFSEEQIWGCYEFASQASFDIGRPKVRETVGFKKRTSP